MALSRWILHRMNRMNRAFTRSDLAPPARSTVRGEDELREPSLRARETGALESAHLGAYAPLVGAIREELDHFVSSQLRLHLAIAERDRFLLTSIDVEPADGDDHDGLLQRFAREFTPEQIKRFLARDVIAHLPNASALDLSQFGGLNAARSDSAHPDDDAYAELLAQLRATSTDDTARTFEVKLKGRWTDTDLAPSSSRPADVAVPVTPLAGSELHLRIEDAGGSRLVTLSSVVPNRRYVIGKGESCDIVVNGAFASRRHCEVWRQNDVWWAGDAGSTNGIRVESEKGVLGRAGQHAGSAELRSAIEIVPGAQIVLSANAKGSAADYPRVLLEQSARETVPQTPLSPPLRVPTTPTTPIAAPLRRPAGVTLTIRMKSGSKSVVLDGKSVPMRVGRSRNQDLVVDWAHEGVSGHHIDILTSDAGGADVQVHGDNGVTVGGVTHSPSTRFRWRVGQPMTLGRASEKEPECSLELTTNP